MENKKTEINYIEEMKKINEEVQSLKETLKAKNDEKKVETKKEVKVETKKEEVKADQTKINEIAELKKTVEDLKTTIKSQYESTFDAETQKTNKQNLENLSEVI